MKNKLLLLFLVVFNLSIGQQRTCGMQDHMNKMMFNPVYKKQYEERQARFEIEYQKLLAKKASKDGNQTEATNATIYIPVAVHFPSVSNAISAAEKDQYRAFAQTQIDVINADYNASNADISNWTTASAFYPGVQVGNMDVQFVIASQNHPAGTGLTNGMKAITFGTDFLAGADNDATWAGYMNFVIRDLGAGLLGYSPLAGSPAAGQTVVMNTWCYGTGSGVPGTTYIPASPFHLGRTVTHELGHFFNLDHIFKSDNPNSTNCGGQDQDGIADTPKQAACTYGCIAPGSKNACIAPQKVLSMNYMDYSDDACMYMFTAGQATRALAYINTILTEYKPNVLGTTEYLSNIFSFYPNPNSGTFTIQFKELVSDFNIEIYDITGKVVFTKEFKQNSDLSKDINIQSEMSKGVYFMNLKTNDGILTKKIIIE